jgi:spermidine synthase
VTFFARWRARKPAADAETPYVSEKFGVRTLHIGSDTVQSAMRIARPHDLELAYTRSMMGFLLFHPRPSRVLLVGLGGGSRAKYIYHHLPWIAIEAVEVSGQVLAIARHYFHLPPEDARFRVVIGDGAAYVQQGGAAADVIAVDGYDAESIVDGLSDKPFYDACHRRLRSGGVLVVNLWGGDRQFNQHLKRIREAFPAGTVCLPAEKPGNVAVFAFRTRRNNPTWQALFERARALESAYGLEFTRFVEGLRKMNRHDREGLLV